MALNVDHSDVDTKKKKIRISNFCGVPLIFTFVPALIGRQMDHICNKYDTKFLMDPWIVVRSCG